MRHHESDMWADDEVHDEAEAAPQDDTPFEEVVSSRAAWRGWRLLLIVLVLSIVLAALLVAAQPAPPPPPTMKPPWLVWFTNII